MYFILHVLIQPTIEVNESIPAFSPYESHKSLLITIFMSHVTFNYVTKLRF